MSFITIFILSLLCTFLYRQNKILSREIYVKKERDKYKQSFLASLVHDLKTPTYAQLNALKQLEKGSFGTLNNEQYQMISLTKESCKYMSDLIGTIMETYKHDFGVITLTKTKFDVIGLIEKLIKETEILTKTSTQKIRIITDVSKYYVEADELQISRVLFNLISNAITYGYSDIDIEIHFIHNCENVEIFVKNKSNPITKSELDTIFDKFKRTKYATFNKASTGLGLYLSKQIIKLHGGDIYAKSELDGTCIFGFKLPINNLSNKFFKEIEKV